MPLLLISFFLQVNLLEFVCGFPIGSSNIDVKTYKLETLKSENLTSCEIDFYPGDVLLMVGARNISCNSFNFSE